MIIIGMGSRITRIGAARATTRSITAWIGAELRNARQSAGLSLKASARAVDMSPAQFGRIERGEIATLTIDQVARACAAVGLKLVVRAYPDADAVIDSPQLHLLARFRRRLPPGARWTDEAPLAIPGDRRAWDALVELGGGIFAVEAETRLGDVQAMLRRIGLKQRDGQVDVVVLLVNDTVANRRAIAAHGADLRRSFPLDGRAILRAIESGQAPPAGGILVL